MNDDFRCDIHSFIFCFASFAIKLMSILRILITFQIFIYIFFFTLFSFVLHAIGAVVCWSLSLFSISFILIGKLKTFFCFRFPRQMFDENILAHSTNERELDFRSSPSSSTHTFMPLALDYDYVVCILYILSQDVRTYGRCSGLGSENSFSGHVKK